MSSLSVRFFNSYKSKYLNFFFYLFDCQVSFALIGFSFLHHRVLYVRLRCTSLDLGSALCAVVGLDGLEPSTSRLSGARSSHLSYRPVFSQVIQFVHLSRFYPWWWRWRDSNPWPPACRAGALPTELHPHFFGSSLRTQLNPDNWTTKSIHTMLIHIVLVFVLIWLRSLKNVSRS